MVEDLNLDVEMLVAPIVREPDGLAMSSRNAYLSQEERKKAVVLNQALNLAEQKVRNGDTDAMAVKGAMIGLINKQKDIAIDYVSIVDPETLEDVEEIKGIAVVALAAKIGTTRLIDNRKLNPL
jgi:pantoate--beta-alanine ligase